LRQTLGAGHDVEQDEQPGGDHGAEHRPDAGDHDRGEPEQAEDRLELIEREGPVLLGQQRPADAGHERRHPEDEQLVGAEVDADRACAGLGVAHGRQCSSQPAPLQVARQGQRQHHDSHLEEVEAHVAGERQAEDRRTRHPEAVHAAGELRALEHEP
jgi:hypothetical protein